MYSLPTSTTLAAFTIASAASMAPTRPLVSTIPSASMLIAGDYIPRARRLRAWLDSARGVPVEFTGLAASAEYSMRSEETPMMLGRSWRTAAVVSLAALALLPACSRRKPAEVNDIVPKFEVNRSRAPLGSAVEITYTWQVEPTAKKLTQDHRAFVHFVDSHGVMLFEDDHTPVPPVTAWEPGQTYTYTRTKFIPVYPYVGDVDVRIGL